MAPVAGNTVEALTDLVHKLESRVQQLETKLGEGGNPSSSSAEPKKNESIRMILMGPPGAGKNRPVLSFSISDPLVRQERELKPQRSKRNTAHVIS